MDSGKDIRKIVGARLRKLREDRMRRDPSWTQAKVAKLLNVSLSLVSTYERGERSISLDNLDMFADLYGVSVDYLMGRTDDPAPQIPVYRAGASIPPPGWNELSDEDKAEAERLTDMFRQTIIQDLRKKQRAIDDERKKGGSGSQGEG